MRSPPCGSVGSPGFDRHAACGQGPVLWFMASSMDHDGPTAMEVEPLESHRCERFRALLHSVSTRPAEQPLLPPRDVREYLRFCQGESTPPCSPERQGTDPHPDCCSWRESLGDLRRSCQFVRGCISVLDQIVQWRLTAGESVQSPKPKPCGARIPAGETAYKCLDCGMDPTCVICLRCFMDSPCVNHNFRMVKSFGGCCDCGDREAWNPASFCKRHSCNKLDPCAQLSADDLMAGNCPSAVLFDTLFEVLALSLEPERDDPRAAFWGGGAPLSPQECEDVLKLCVVALRDGRLDPIREVMSKMITRVGVEVHNCHVGARGRCIAPHNRSGTHLERLLLLYVDAPEKVQEQLDELIHKLLPEYSFKSSFCASFAELYLDLIRRSRREPVAKGVLMYSVQLLTVPSLAASLGELGGAGGNGEGLVGRLLNWLVEQFQSTVSSWQGNEDGQTSDKVLDWAADCRNVFFRESKYTRVVMDLQYLLRHHAVVWTLLTPPPPGDATAGVPAFHLILKTLRLLQCASPARRFHGLHILFEDQTWKNAFHAELQLTSILRLACGVFLVPPSRQYHDFPTLNLDVSIAAIRLVQQELCSWLEARGMRGVLRSSGWGLGMKFRASVHHVSYRVPLHRAYARIILESLMLLKKECDGSQSSDAVGAETLLDVKHLPSGFARAVLEHLMRISALSAQVGAGVWVRNGMAMLNQVLPPLSSVCWFFPKQLPRSARNRCEFGVLSGSLPMNRT